MEEGFTRQRCNLPVFEDAAWAVGFGFYPRAGCMHVDLGPTRQ